jgi:hypothetical protein
LGVDMVNRSPSRSVPLTEEDREILRTDGAVAVEIGAAVRRSAPVAEEECEGPGAAAFLPASASAVARLKVLWPEV